MAKLSSCCSTWRDLVILRRWPIIIRVGQETAGSKSVARVGLRWVAETLRSRGFVGAIRYYVQAVSELILDLTPTRRKSRYGDIDYDVEHDVETTWANISLTTRVRELLSEGQYQPSEPTLFHEILQSVPADPAGFTFIDLGSGKGRTLLMASDYPFRGILGVELLSELNQVATRNLQRYSSEQQKCFALESHTGDARDFVSLRPDSGVSIQSVSRARAAQCAAESSRISRRRSPGSLCPVSQPGFGARIRGTALAPASSPNPPICCVQGSRRYRGAGGIISSRATDTVMDEMRSFHFLSLLGTRHWRKSGTLFSVSELAPPKFTSLKTRTRALPKT